MGLQKYKIYINGKPVLLISPEQLAEIGAQPDKNNFVSHYSGKKKMIIQYLDLLDKNKDIEQVVLMSKDLDKLWKDFQSCFRVLEAAGAFVQNEDGKLLVFYRRGSWDMPKGKIDPGETPEQAAIREVQEETGLINLKIEKFLMPTWHTYEQNDKRILKKTWWYLMTTSDQKVTPQTEEDIVEIRWVNARDWIKQETHVYSSIRDVIHEALK
ncbi:MAG: NUDIX domain-containing protein [Saprospiraceae bacterium]